MSLYRARKRWQDAYALRRGIFLFFVFSFAMVALFKCLKIVNEPQHRQEFHQFVSSKIKYLRGD